MDLQKYENRYNVRSYESDRNNNLRLVALLNIFQDMADAHAAQMGLGLKYCLANGLAWVGSNYEIEIKRLPRIHEDISIRTWPAVEKKLGAIRDFEVFGDGEERIITASSQWILIDFHKRRPVPLREHLPQYQILDERALDTEFAKIQEVERIDEQTKFRVRFDDIDLNKHVNNAVYVLWASEAVDPEFRLKHNPFKISVNFKKEGHMGEKIMVKTEMNGLHSRHSIWVYDGGENDRELARAEIEWQPRAE